jgi:parvulin-like peptidyl-prolyl isomerase
MIRDGMIVTAMRQQMVEKYVTATPADMAREYRENKALYRQGSKTTVSVILLKPTDAGDKKSPSVSTRGEEIFGRLEKGEDFAEIARRFSADSHAKDGGVWKDVNPQEAFRPEIAQTIAALKVGQVSKLVDLDGWGFIVRKDAETSAKELTFAEAYDEIESNVKKRLGQEAYKAWIQRLRDAAFIKIYPFPEDK